MSRNWCFTYNDYSEQDVLDLCFKLESTYIVIGREVGESGNKHLQGYIEFAGTKRFNTLKKFNSSIHWEKRKGTAIQAADYCKKEGNFVEFGEISKQGKRNDLDDIKEQIIKGKCVDDIVMENPIIYHQYGRTLQKIEDIVNRKKFRTIEPTCTWYYGKTGVGKSTIWRQQYNPETMYLWSNDNGWWDGYTGQDTIIIDEFRGQIPYSELLMICGGAPGFLRRRNRPPIACLASKVIITSSMKPQDVFFNLAAEDNIDQLLRRLTVSEVVKR